MQEPSYKKVTTAPMVKVEVNGAPVVTAKGPQSVFAFGQTFANALRGSLDPFGF